VLNQHPEYLSITREAKEVQEMLEQTNILMQSYQEYEEFLDIVGDAVQFLAQLLSSKTIPDTIETIKVFRLLYQYGIKDAKLGIKKMLTLVFSKDASV
jgi:condensin complex subunit 1